MHRMFLGLVVAGSVLLPLPARAQGAIAGAKPVLNRSTASGLEIAILEVKQVERFNQFGQALVRFGSCPPGVAPKGMETLELIVLGQATVVHFTITVLPTYSTKALAGPPRVIDVEGGKHDPHRPYLLPEAGLLTKLRGSGQALHCEFPFAVSADAVSAVEFEGVRLDRQ